MTDSFDRAPLPGAPTPAGAEPLRVSAAVAAPPLVAALLVSIIDQPTVIDLLVMAIGVVVAVLVTMRLVVQPMLESIQRARAVATASELELLAERADQDFRDRLDRALRGSDAEPATLRTGLRAVAELAPEADISLLLSVPEEPRIGWRVRLADGALKPARPVDGAPSCVALMQGGTTQTDSSRSLDACPHLHDPQVDVSATCVPLRLGDRSLGTVCVAGAPGEQLDAATLARIEWAVERTGVRVAEQRLLRGPSVEGRTDPLTGLPGQGTLKNHLRDLVRSLSPFCVAIVEIDAYGEIETDDDADEALRLVAEALCATLRPDDLVCRLPGSQFAAVLAHCSAEQASSALERARESLVLMLAEEGGVHVTCSTGIVESHRATSLEEILSLATTACSEANDAGGNRVTVSRGVTA